MSKIETTNLLKNKNVNILTDEYIVSLGFHMKEIKGNDWSNDGVSFTYYGNGNDSFKILKRGLIWDIYWGLEFNPVRIKKTLSMFLNWSCCITY